MCISMTLLKLMLASTSIIINLYHFWDFARVTSFILVTLSCVGMPYFFDELSYVLSCHHDLSIISISSHVGSGLQFQF